jgi:hypothetical protein
MYADPAQLGWDPSIIRRLCPITHKVQYDITIHPRDAPPVTYRTKEMISNIGAEALRGRGTRVWKAVKLVKEVGNVEVLEDVSAVVIKDSWVDSDRKREGRILEEIRASTDSDSATREFLDRHFLTVICYGDVLIGGEADTTDMLQRRGKAVPSGHGKLRLNLKAYRGARGQIPVVNATPEPGPSTRNAQGMGDFVEYAAKVHHRTVFAEVGVPIQAIGSLSDVFEALGSLVPGKSLLYD